MSCVRSPCKKLKLLYRKGFSLPEIIVCLGSILALSTAAVIGSEVIMKNGRYNAAKANVSAISIAVSQYRFETGNYPANLNVLTSVDEATGKGPWIVADSIFDPWHNEYMLYVNGTSGFAVWSMGADGQNNSGEPVTEFNSGGEGDDIGVFGR